MSKRPNLMAGFETAQPVVVPIKFDAPAIAQPLAKPVREPEPDDVDAPPQETARPKAKRKDRRANHRPFTVWLDQDLTARLRTLSRDLVEEEGRTGNSIEALVTKAIGNLLKKHGR